MPTSVVDKFADHYGYHRPLLPTTRAAIVERLQAEARRHRLFHGLLGGYTGYFSDKGDQYDEWVLEAGGAAEAGEFVSPLSEKDQPRVVLPALALSVAQLDETIASMEVVLGALKRLRGDAS